ncbi:MAG: hypothetical protein GF309_05535 [Candidatus Lokiarchaeota archaeon]|nr:hypothetical protein [Candidatus Lokiarchaeota archaeon]
MDDDEWESKWRLFEEVEFSSGRREALEEALKWWHVCSYYIFMTMQANAEEQGFLIEDYDYYDGFLSYIDRILDDYFENEANNKRMLEHLFDGVDDMAFNDGEDDEEIER